MKSRGNSNIIDLNFELDTVLMGVINDKSIAVYPHKSEPLKVAFIYGTNFMQQRNGIIYNYSLLLLLNFVFFAMAPTALCFIRRKLKLRGNGLLSCTIDMIIIFVGGGRLRLMHKFEKWFFGIFSIAALFINAFGFQSTLYPSFLLPSQNIDTFEQLAAINPPVYIGQSFVQHMEVVTDMLRFDS